jgi:hypothetical protein
VLLEDLKKLSLPTLSDGEGLKGYEYLLRMRVDRLKASALQELEKEVLLARTKSESLRSTKPESLWLSDLDEFLLAWTEYESWRQRTYEFSTGAVPLKKKVVRKKVDKAEKAEKAAKTAKTAKTEKNAKNV